MPHAIDLQAVLVPSNLLLNTIDDDLGALMGTTDGTNDVPHGRYQRCHFFNESMEGAYPHAHFTIAVIESTEITG
jgi:hypothetical protein